MTLDELLKTSFESVTADSRAVRSGAVFVAVRGGQSDGHAFLSQAEKAGAKYLVGEVPKPHEITIPYIQVQDSRDALAELAAAHFGDPSRAMRMIGITGTSGKTTITYLLESILEAAGERPGVIGTVSFRYPGHVVPASHTTPGVVELQELLAQMRSAGCTAAVMEVSSHALRQKRVARIAFDAVAFTNLSPEHLDFHADMEDYFAAKSLLFTEYARYSATQGKNCAAVINEEDAYGARLVRDLRAAAKASGGEIAAMIEPVQVPGDYVSALTGIRGRVGDSPFESPLTGSFNAQNIAMAVALARKLGIPNEPIARGISHLKCVPGRLERVPNSKGIHVFVDYAHKPDALKKVLASLHALRGRHRLIVVFGCGGDRDRKKRPMMGEIGVSGSDFCVITSDNPRTEDPRTIISEILAGVPKGLPHERYIVEADRKKGIFEAIRRARPGDVVLIAGKGHEDYQILPDSALPGGTRKIHFDDREVASEALAGDIA